MRARAAAPGAAGRDDARKTGFEVCQAVRADDALAATRILMLTAKGRDTDVAKGLALGADAYMTKPFSTKELVQKVREMLEAGRRREARPGERARAAGRWSVGRGRRWLLALWLVASVGAGVGRRCEPTSARALAPPAGAAAGAAAVVVTCCWPAPVAVAAGALPTGAWVAAPARLLEQAQVLLDTDAAARRCSGRRQRRRCAALAAGDQRARARSATRCAPTSPSRWPRPAAASSRSATAWRR